MTALSADAKDFTHAGSSMSLIAASVRDLPEQPSVAQVSELLARLAQLGVVVERVQGATGQPRMSGDMVHMLARAISRLSDLLMATAQHPAPAGARQLISNDLAHVAAACAGAARQELRGS